MKKIIVFIFLVYLGISCSNQDDFTVHLSNDEWNNLYLELILSRVKEDTKIYYQYDTSNSELLILIYETFNTSLNYDINNSVIKYLENRKNKVVEFKINDKEIESDTTAKNYIKFSEPFYFDKNRFMFSILTWHEVEENRNMMVYFCERKNNSIKVTNFYNYNLGRLYNNITPSHWNKK
jgi:hypothetical protein